MKSMSMSTLFISSKTDDRAAIEATNFWSSDLARRGGMYVSMGFRCFRVLVPAANVDEIRNELRSADYAIASRGPWSEHRVQDALEFVFEDHTESPFSIAVGPEQLDTIPLPADNGRTDLRCIVYGPGLEVLADLPAKFRVVRHIPCLEPWTADAPVPTQTPARSASPLSPVTVGTGIAERIAKQIGASNDPSRRYLKPLSPAVARWYCYTKDLGHSVLCLLERDVASGHLDDEHLVPVPVRTVMRGHKVKNGYVVVNLTYDPHIGLQFPDGDEEFASVVPQPQEIPVRVGASRAQRKTLKDVLDMAAHWGRPVAWKCEPRFFYVRQVPGLPPIFGAAFTQHPANQNWWSTAAYSAGCPTGEVAFAEPLNPSEITRISTDAFLKAANAGWDERVIHQFTEEDLCP
jgi:hypothetical protein